MFRAFRSQSISSQLLLPLFGFIPFIGVLVFRNVIPVIPHNAQGWLYSFYCNALAERPVWLVMASYLQILFLAYLFHWMNIRYEILGQRTVLLAYLIVFLNTIPVFSPFLHPAAISAIFILLGLLFLFRLYHNDKPLPDIFNAGLFLGFSGLIYPPSLLFSFVFLVALVWLKEPKWRDFSAFLMGFLSPFWVVGVILYLTGSLSYQWMGFKQWFEIRSSWPPVVPGNPRMVVIWLLFILVSFPLILTRARSKKDAGRRVMSILMHFLWLVPLVLLLFERVSFELWQFFLLPLAVMYSFAILNARTNWIANLLFMALLVFFVLFQLELWIR